MPRLCRRRCSVLYYFLFTAVLFTFGISFFRPLTIVEDEFGYSTVIYPSLFDTSYTDFSIYLNKKDRLASNEDQISLSKHHKVLDNGHRELDQNEKYLIIEYTKFFGREKFCKKNSTEIYGDQCPYKNCFYSCNHSLATQAQLLLFHKYDTKPTTVPSINFTRKSSQIWLLWHDEPNFYHGYDLNIYKFNWTTSYVFDAEASIGAYGITLKRNQALTDEEFNSYISKEFSSRYHQALWFVTNCGAKRRLNYFRELRKYFPIQVFGSCVQINESSPSIKTHQPGKIFHNNTLLPTSCNRWSSCEKDQLKSNMFYLAFESQSCKDYITEKFWRAVKYGLIPIALGPLSKEHYRRIAPPNSFIYTDDFPNAKALADHMYDIMNNEKLFRFYHNWRKYYYTGHTADELEKYRLCETACGALGYFDGKNYLKDDDCEDALRILLRCLKYENERKDARLQMLESKIIENDLVPILVHLDSKHDIKITHHALKLLVNLTKPPLVCFDGKIPKDVTLTNVYLKIENHLQKTKTNLANEKLFDFLVHKVQPVLDRDWLDRSDEDDFIVHAVFTLVRNILSIKSERQISEESDINAHDLVLWAIHKSNMENLILYSGNKAQGDERIMNILEIVVLILREQSAEELASTGEQQSKNQREKHNEALDLLYEREVAEKQQLSKLTNRRSAFGAATYVMCNAKGIGENQLICHRPLQNLNAMEFDREKRRFRRPKNRAPVKNDLDDSQHHHSALGIRLFLREFCLAFLDNCYNILMPRAREMIIKSTCLLSDETNFFWAIRFFTEFNRHAHSSIDRISETLQMNTFHLLHTKIDHYREMIKIDKPEARLWAKRLQIGFGAFKEYILCVKSMLTNPDELVTRAATIIKNNIFYMQEYREQIYLLLKDYDNTKMTNIYLHDLVESTHEFLKLLEEHTTKLKHVFVQRRRVARKEKPKKKKNEKQKEISEPPNEQLEEEWQNEISEKLSRLLQGLEETNISKSDVCPFDALSEVPVDDQSITAVARIQHALRTNKLDEAIALFRASREVWQTEKAFGYEDIGAEEEFNLLREIYMTSKMDNLLPKNDDEEDEEEEEEEEEGEREGDEDDEEPIHTIEREEEFDFKKFIMRFAHSSILSSYIDVFRTYRNNSPYLNHCIIRMLYRVSVDCQFPGILFQMSLFRILQKFHLDPLSKSQQFSELSQFSIWLLRKFFGAIEKNPYIYAELLFWKDRSIVEEMLDGYRQTTRNNEGESKTKAAAWSVEHQIELRDLFRKIKEEQIENIGMEKGDIVDRIMLELTDKTKARRQIIKELKNQDLIKTTRELKLKKPSRRQSKKRDFLDNSDIVDSDSDNPDRDDGNRSIENKSISSDHEEDKSNDSKSSKKKTQVLDDDDISNDSNSTSVKSIPKKSSKKKTQVLYDDDISNGSNSTSVKSIPKKSSKKKTQVLDDDDEDKSNDSNSKSVKSISRKSSKKNKKTIANDYDDEDKSNDSHSTSNKSIPIKKKTQVLDDDDISNDSNSTSDKSIPIKKKTKVLDDDDISNDSNSKSNKSIPVKSSKKNTQVLDDDDDEESLPVLTKQSRKYESSSMFNDNDDNDDDDDISSSRPIKKARRQLASSSEDDD